MKDVPIFICSKDRASYLQTLVLHLKIQGYHNIHVLDMGSTYEPMLELLNRIPAIVHRCGEQPHPHIHFWRMDLIKETPWYVYTDSDVIPDCPEDWAEQMLGLFKENMLIEKIGLGLRLDDLPDHFTRKGEVLQWEGQFWANRWNEMSFLAEVDTTFAMYRGRYHRTDPAAHISNTHSLRMDKPYVARHLPWYANSAQPTEEHIYYLNHMQPEIGHWR